MPRRSELGWILVMVVVAVTLGFFIGGGPSLLRQRDDAEPTSVVAASAGTTTTIAAEPTTTVVAETTTTVATRPAGDVVVRVYNGSTKAGQAVRTGDQVKAKGYQVLAPGPSPADPLARSVVHYIEGYAAEATALALAMGLPARAAEAMPNPPPVTGAPPANLVLIVADDLVVSA